MGIQAKSRSVKISGIFSVLLLLGLSLFSWFELSDLRSEKLRATWETRKALIYNSLKGLSTSILASNWLLREENLRPLFRDHALTYAVVATPDQMIVGGFRLLSRNEDHALLVPIIAGEESAYGLTGEKSSFLDQIFFGEIDEWELFETQESEDKRLLSVVVPLLGPKVNNQRDLLGTLHLKFDLKSLFASIAGDQRRFVGSLMGLALLLIFTVYRMTRSFEDNMNLRLVHESLQANKQLTEAFAHDVRKPFYLFRSLQETLPHAKTADDLRELLDTFREEIDSSLLSVQGMIDDTLELASGRSLELSRVKLRELIGEALDSSLDRHPRFGQSIHWNLEFDPEIEWDRSRMLRVFWNLFENAFQAMNADSQLFIHTRLSGDGKLLVSVRNTGVVISAIDRERIFQAGFTKRGQGGTGLGLCIVRDLVVRHGGEVWCESDAERGVEFLLALPLVATKVGGSSGEERAS